MNETLGFCPFCEDTTEIKLIQQDEPVEFTYQEQKYSMVNRIYLCRRCGREYELNINAKLEDV